MFLNLALYFQGNKSVKHLKKLSLGCSIKVQYKRLCGKKSVLDSFSFPNNDKTMRSHLIITTFEVMKYI